MRTRVAPHQHARRLLLGAASLALSWATAVAITGGLLVHTPWGPLSSRKPGRPLAFGIAAALAYLLWCRRHWTSDLAPLARVRWPTAACGAAIAAAFLAGISWNSFFGAGPDASGYLSQSAMWLRGALTWPAPEWVDGAPWPDAAATSAPVGYRPGPVTTTIVPTYPPGLPLLMAAFHVIGGPNAVYLVVPVFGALAVWATFRIASRLAGDAAGAIASALLLSSPTFLVMLVQPMSDVPAAALWALAIVATFGSGIGHAAAAGLLSGAAILVRPNLVPLAALVAAMVTARSASPRLRLARLLAFAATAAPAALALAALNTALHGGPLRSGYGALGDLYAVERILPNLRSYGSALLDTQTPVVLLAFAVPMLMARHGAARREAIAVATAWPLLVLALYLPYERFRVWWFLRFLLPAYPALLGGTAAAMVLLALRRGAARWRRWVLATVLAVVAIHGFKRAYDEGVFGIRNADRRYAAAAEYAATLPQRSVLVSLLHSGTLHYYTGRDILRWDALAATRLDDAVAYLAGRGYAVYLVLDPSEAGAFRQRFAGARVMRYLQPEYAAHLHGSVLVYPLDPLSRAGNGGQVGP